MKRQNGVYHTIDKILCLLHLILGKSANHISINIERPGTFHTYSKVRHRRSPVLRLWRTCCTE